LATTLGASRALSFLSVGIRDPVPSAAKTSLRAQERVGCVRPIPSRSAYTPGQGRVAEEVLAFPRGIAEIGSNPSQTDDRM
jgi:hypothetical protein